MAQPEQSSDAFWEQLQAPYPPPPPFWKLFTTENLQRLREAESQPDFDPEYLPYELLVLRPPPAPQSAESYTTFNHVHYTTAHPTLPPEHEELLFKPEELTKATGTARPHVRLLWQLTKSLNLNFLELCTIMADNPVDYLDKVNDIGMLMENINAVLNLLRPHQAREQLKTMLLDRLDAGKEELEKCDEMRNEIETFLKDVEDNAATRAHSVEASTVTRAIHGSDLRFQKIQKSQEVEKLKKAWHILDELDGD